MDMDMDMEMPRGAELNSASTSTRHKRTDVVETMISSSASSSSDPATTLRARHQQFTESCKQAVRQIERSAEACVDAVVKDFEAWARWSYRDMTGERWDAQPACFITDYVLALEALWFGASCARAAIASGDATTTKDITWYQTYFYAMGVSAACGGLLHHLAFEVLRGIAGDPKRLVHNTRVFGIQLTRRTIDRTISVLWRVTLGSCILSNFALVALAARRYIADDTWLLTIMAIATTLYVVLTVVANVILDARFLVGGFLPAMCFGLINSTRVFQWQWDHAASEILVYLLKFFSGMVQGLAVSPSRERFNHNALSHVIMCIATSMMFVHFRLP